jgi:hypothetical protein
MIKIQQGLTREEALRVKKGQRRGLVVVSRDTSNGTYTIIIQTKD